MQSTLIIERVEHTLIAKNNAINESVEERLKTMTKFYANINKGDLLLVAHRDKRVFDGVVGMIAKRDIESQSQPIGSTVGRPQGYCQWMTVDMNDFETLGNFYELTGVPVSYNERIAVDHKHLVVPDNCKWVIKNALVRW